MGSSAILAGNARSAALTTALVVGVVSGAGSVVDAVAFATLIWAGIAGAYLASGIAAILLGAGLMAIIVAARSSYVAAVAEPQDSSLAVLTLATTAAAAAIPAAAAADRFASVAGIIAITSLATGVVFLALGHLRLGGVVRYLPFPVIGGFIAGTGWLLVEGALALATDTETGLEIVHALGRSEAAKQVIPAVLFGVGMVVLLGRTSHPLAVPLYVAAAAVLFYLVLATARLTLDDARELKLLLGPFPEGQLWSTLRFPEPWRMRWDIVWQQLPLIGAVVLVSVMGALLSATGLELAVRRDLDLDHELKAAGWANLASGAVGSPPGFHALDISILAHKLGAESRVVGLMTGTVCLAALAIDARVLGYVPNLIPAGLLLFLGIEFLREWVWEGYGRMPRLDWLIMLLILVLIGSFGFVTGVAAGVLVSMVIFVYNYAGINVIRGNFTGAEFASHVDRPRAVRVALTEHGGEVLILLLEGFLFFGTAARLVSTVRSRLADSAQLRFLVMDFERVRGVDSSAASAFARLLEISEERGCTIVLSHMSDVIVHQMAANGLDLASKGLRVFPDVDQAMEWCEERMLETIRIHADAFDARVRLRDVDGPEAAALLDRLTPETYPDGHVLIHRGEVSRDMFLLSAGRLRVQIPLEDGHIMRLRSVTAGAIIGEVAYVLGHTRGADVVVEGSATLYRISPETIQRLESEGVPAQALLDHFIARALTERLTEANRTIQAALR